eukprot:6173946-Pyramimonas_sp.AAC.1
MSPHSRKDWASARTTWRTPTSASWSAPTTPPTWPRRPTRTARSLACPSSRCGEGAILLSSAAVCCPVWVSWGTLAATR